MSPKEKFPLYLSPEKKATLERRHTEDGSRSITGFIENAIDFYLDYLSANNSGLFLPSAVQSYLDGRLNQMENRMASLLFKQAVELDMGLSMLFKCVNVSEEELRRQRAESVRHTFATHALTSGVDAKTLSGILGHTKASFTLDTYTHVTGDMQRGAAEIVGGFLTELLGEELEPWQRNENGEMAVST